MMLSYANILSIVTALVAYYMVHSMHMGYFEVSHTCASYAEYFGWGSLILSSMEIEEIYQSAIYVVIIMEELHLIIIPDPPQHNPQCFPFLFASFDLFFVVFF